MTIVEHIPDFKEYLTALLGRRPSTVRRYARTLELFQEWLVKKGGAGGSDVLEVKRGDVEDWLKDLYYTQGNLKNITRATKLAALKKFWKFLLYCDVIAVDPMELIPTPQTQVTMPEKFSTSSLRKLFASPDRLRPKGVRDRAILKVLYGCGPRVDEIRRLTIDDIFMDGANSYVYFHTKGGKRRLVKLSKNPTEELNQWMLIREQFVASGCKAVFVSMARNRPGLALSVGAYNNILKGYAEAVGIPDERVFVHKMRSTFATNLYDMGFGLKEISIQMGHESVKSTERYIAISDAALKKTAIPEKRWKELDG